jgi:putative iron-dependent peroxidase
MLDNMFIGLPPGNYDRLLDFSRAVTGSLFFVPSATWLEEVAPGDASPAVASPATTEAIAGSAAIDTSTTADAAAATTEAIAGNPASGESEAEADDEDKSTARRPDGSLGIGSLKKEAGL